MFKKKKKITEERTLLYPLTEYFGNGITHHETHLGQKLRLVPPQPLQSLQEEGGFTESQEASNVGGCQGHHLSVLIEKLEEQERRSQVLLNIQILLVWTEQLSKAQAHPSTLLRGVCASKKKKKKTIRGSEAACSTQTLSTPECR